MKAIHVLDDDARSLAWTDTADLTPGPGQVVVRTAATAVNRADLLQRRGLYPVPPGASPIMGLEVAGTVEALGDGVTSVAPGDRVCALLEGGGYAEQVCIDASMLLPVPAGLDFVQAAALPEVFYTAWLNVFLETDIAEGESVLVHAAASGVGTAAVQLCRAFGHPCVGTASAAKLDAVRALGADVAIDRAELDIVALAKAHTKGGFDVILDPVGGSYLEANVRALAKRGRLVNIGLLGGARAELDIARLLTRRLRVIGSVLRSRSRAEKVAITASLRERVWPLFDDGTLRPVVHTTLPITEAEAAHGLLKDNATVGKVVLTVGDTSPT